MPKSRTELIVALDVDTKEKACDLIDQLCPIVRYFKVGSLFAIYGPQIIDHIKEKGCKAFLDMKWYDIPNTVYNFVAAGTGTSYQAPFISIENNIEDKIKKENKNKAESGVFMMSVHVRESQSRDMLLRAKKGAEDKARELGITRPFVVGITVLTSENPPNVKDVVLERAKIAKEAGLDGVVCSVHEANAVREQSGKSFLIVTPGIRPKGSTAGDQKRVATASDAAKAGANYIVVGRPIIHAKDPRKVAIEIIKNLDK